MSNTIASKSVDRGANPRDCATLQLRQRVKTISADTLTPVALYLRLRDHFPGAVLLESGDVVSGEGRFSYIALNPVAEIMLREKNIITRFPGAGTKTKSLDKSGLRKEADDFLQALRFEENPEIPEAASCFGYTAYDAVSAFENISETNESQLPELRYRFYQYVLVFDHRSDLLYCCEHEFPGSSSGMKAIEKIILHKGIPEFPFAVSGTEKSDSTDAEFLQMAEAGKAHCRRGDVFQVVLSRCFTQAFTGDDFNVYRSLRAINPSPYLFYFDYTDYRLFGSSPEAQLKVRNGKALVHPIAGTFRRTGNAASDQELAEKLRIDPKENAEHVMLVDLARNDLSRFCADVEVEKFRSVQYYSHVIHLVSEISGDTGNAPEVFSMLADTFPAGTLSGAPKIRAMQIIREQEKSPRGWYGGSIGALGPDGLVNQAILIRSFFSRNNVLHYRAGAGITIHSDSLAELNEIHHKLAALREAIRTASNAEICAS